MKPLITGKTGTATGVRIFKRVTIYALFAGLLPLSWWKGRVMIDTLSIGRIVQ